MQIRLVCVGQKMPAWVTTAVQEYAVRMPAHCRFVVQEVAPAKRSKQGVVSRYLADEASRLEEVLAVGNPLRVVLDERGALVDTRKLSHKLDGWLQSGRDVALVVGGPDGLDERVKASADWTWSLTPLTLPHPMVRVMLSEQMYRAWSLLNNHPYHRE